MGECKSHRNIIKRIDIQTEGELSIRYKNQSIRYIGVQNEAHSPKYLLDYGFFYGFCDR